MVDKRRIIEVLKWLSPKDVLLNTSIVSLFWCDLSACDELWILFTESEDMAPIRPPGLLFKHGYISLLRDRYVLLLSPDELRKYHCKTDHITRELKFRRRLIRDSGEAAIRSWDLHIKCDSNDAFSTLKLSDGIAALIVSEGRLFLCGGNNKKSYIATPTGEVTSLTDMNERRSYHSVAYCGGTVYVFGGIEVKSAEKLSGSCWKWLPEPVVHHSACMPCALYDRIYLCGGNTAVCELFYVSTETYEVLPFSLPESAFGCATFRGKDGVVMITQQFVSYWSGGKALRSVENAENYSGVWTSTKQCLWGNCVYSVTGGVVRRFDLQTGVREAYR